MITVPIRLVALDLDGTLVGKDLVIRPRVRDAIARARARGVMVTIVTGRMFAATRPFALSLMAQTIPARGRAWPTVASGVERPVAAAQQIHPGVGHRR